MDVFISISHTHIWVPLYIYIFLLFSHYSRKSNQNVRKSFLMKNVSLMAETNFPLFIFFLFIHKIQSKCHFPRKDPSGRNNLFLHFSYIGSLPYVFDLNFINHIFYPNNPAILKKKVLTNMHVYIKTITKCHWYRHCKRDPRITKCCIQLWVIFEIWFQISNFWNLIWEIYLFISEIWFLSSEIIN